MGDVRFFLAEFDALALISYEHLQLEDMARSYTNSRLAERRWHLGVELARAFHLHLMVEVKVLVPALIASGSATVVELSAVKNYADLIELLGDIAHSDPGASQVPRASQLVHAVIKHIADDEGLEGMVERLACSAIDLMLFGDRMREERELMLRQSNKP